MTIAQAKRLYRGAGSDTQHSKEEWKSIRKEMEIIVAAESDRAAGKTIYWWGCWDWSLTATSFARKVRELARKLGIG